MDQDSASCRSPSQPKQARTTMKPSLGRPALPPELVGEFIKWSIIPPLGCAQRSRFMELRSVSQIWRDIALSTPYLWSGLSIDVQDTFTSRSVHTWLDRAYGLPLTFHITDASNHQSSLGPAAAALNDLLLILSEDRNWSSISLPSSSLLYTSGEYEKVLQKVKEASFQPWINLWKLEIMCSNHRFLSPVPYEAEGESVWHLPIDVCAPNLEDLRLEIHSTEVRLRPHHWLQKLSLFISSAQYVSILEHIIGQLPELRQLEVHWNNELEYQNTALVPELVHDKIEDLSLDGPNALCFTRYLRVPNLKSLVLECSLRGAISSHASLASIAKFLSDSGCSLRQLDIHRVQTDYYEAGISKILRATPLLALEHLSFRTQQFPKQLSHEITAQKQTPSPLLLPSIARIDLYGQRPSFSERQQRLPTALEQGSQNESPRIHVVLHSPSNAQIGHAWRSTKHSNAIARLAAINVHFSVRSFSAEAIN
ncbi:hypothetical protein BKA70DRAFT_1287272 [Coprinopsis sp. MPI-PUGE-AT-0042]|nr:hypothetical protein BKA70DRAFT_1287272 [Coprinopsis sp. MPI-PUGE-AT-0042]